MTCKNDVIRVQLQWHWPVTLKKVFSLVLFIFSVGFASAQANREAWVDSVFRTMDDHEKLGQLIFISANPSNEKSIDQIVDKVKQNHIGGIVIEHAGPLATTALINHLQRSSKIPILIALRSLTALDSTIEFLPYNTIGAIHNDSMLYHLGEIIASRQRLIGAHMNLGLDISLSGPAHSGMSDNKIRLAKKMLNILHGMQDHSISAAAFRDKNDLMLDRTVSYSTAMDTASLHVIRTLIGGGLKAVITTQFGFTVVENKQTLPAPLASTFVQDVLKNKWNFNGISIYDVQSDVKPRQKKKLKRGELETMAIIAGNEIILDPDNLNPFFKFFQNKMKKDPKLREALDQKVKKILLAKFDAGLSHARPVDRDNLLLKLNPPDDFLFKHQMAEAVITVVKNEDGIVPISLLQDRKFLCLTIGGVEAENDFNHYLNKYVGIQKHHLKDLTDTVGLHEKLNNASVIFVGIFRLSEDKQPAVAEFLKQIDQSKQIVISVFDSDISSFTNFPTVLAGYSNQPIIQQKMAQVIFGGIAATGVLPYAITSRLHDGYGIVTGLSDRFSYSVPEAAEMDSKTLEQISTIANEAIDMKATPGCEILVARNGKIIYDKAFGHLTYDKKDPVTDETIWDLASVTKVSATLQAVMFMYEKGLIDINKKVSAYLPQLKKSNKRDLTIKDILTHQAGLWPFLPFWAQTVKDTVQLPEYYAKKGSPDYPYPVSANLYASRGMKDSLWHWIINAKIQEKNNRVPYDYKYSDMGFYIMQHLAEKMLNQPMEEFLDQNFYEVLGASTTGYLPLLKFPASRIAPTENDKLFRRSQLVGYVHDQGAAMHGGIAGHAGLFSTGNDLAKLGQMWLQKGSYGGHKFFKPETVNFFTMKQFEMSRRGLGWDKPTVSDPNGPTSAFASADTFGHTGFTGISIWIDPEFDLVFIFLSNRVYPEMTNNKILHANIRPRVQDVVYRSIFSYCEYHNQETRNQFR